MTTLEHSRLRGVLVRGALRRGARPAGERSPASWSAVGLGRRASRLGVRTKVVGVVAALAAAAVLTGGLSVLSLQHTASATREVVAVHDRLATPVEEIRRVQLGAQMLVSDLAASRTADRRAELLGLQEVNDAVLTAAFAEAEAGGAATLDSWTELVDASTAWLEVRDTQLVAAATSGDYARYESLVRHQGAPAAERVAAASSAVSAEVVARSDAVAGQAGATATSSITTVLTTLAVSVLLAVVLSVLVTTGIRWGLTDVESALVGLAGGDLTVRARTRTQDEVGRMATALGVAQDSLGSTLRAVTTGTSALSGTAGTLAAGAARVSADSAAQSTRTGQAAGDAASVSTHVEAVADGAERTRAGLAGVARSAVEAARVGRDAAEHARTADRAVHELEESSEEIRAVVAAITGIARQTHLLALNATIEAARAGEAGRGFAVVAGEVKDLAQDSARAAEDIARRVADNTTRTTVAVTSIGRITGAVEEMVGHQETIAAAVAEQTATIGEVHDAATEAAEGSRRIAAALLEIDEAARRVDAELGTFDAEVRDVADRAEDLRTRVETFRF